MDIVYMNDKISQFSVIKRIEYIRSCIENTGIDKQRMCISVCEKAFRISFDV